MRSAFSSFFMVFTAMLSAGQKYPVKHKSNTLSNILDGYKTLQMQHIHVQTFRFAEGPKR